MTPAEVRELIGELCAGGGVPLHGARLVPVAERQDLAQEAVLRFLRKCSHLHFESPDKVRAYLNRIHQNLVRARGRRRGHHETHLAGGADIPDVRRTEAESAREERVRPVVAENAARLLSCFARWFPGEDARLVMEGIRDPAEAGHRFRTYKDRFLGRIRRRLSEDRLTALACLSLRRWSWVAPSLVNDDPASAYAVIREEMSRESRRANERMTTDYWARSFQDDWRLTQIWERHDELDNLPVVRAYKRYGEGAELIKRLFDREYADRRRRQFVEEMTVRGVRRSGLGTLRLDLRMLSQRAEFIPPLLATLVRAARALREAAGLAVQGRDRRLFQLSHAMLRYSLGRFQVILRMSPNLPAVREECLQHAGEIRSMIDGLMGDCRLDLQVAADSSLWRLEELFLEGRHDEASALVAQFQQDVKGVAGIDVPGTSSLEDLLEIE